MSDQRQGVPSQTEARGEPNSPTDLPPGGWKEALKRALAEFKKDRGTFLAAGMAFFWFLAIFPALLAAVGLTGLLDLTRETISSITGAIKSALPGNAAQVLTDALDQATMRAKGGSVVATLIGASVALWSASAGMVALQEGLNIVYEVAEDRTYLKKRLRALVLIGAFVVLGGVATAAIVFGGPIGHAIEGHIGFGAVVFNVLWTVVRWVVGLLALAALFATLYYLGPNRETPRWTWLSPGGAVATVIWLLASVGFSLYVTKLGSYAQTYGSLTGVVVLLLWLYLSAIAVILGGEVNAELERQGERQRRRERQTRPPKPARTRSQAQPPTVQIPAAPPPPPPAPVPVPSAPPDDDDDTGPWARQLRGGWGSN